MTLTEAESKFLALVRITLTNNPALSEAIRHAAEDGLWYACVGHVCALCMTNEKAFAIIGPAFSRLCEERPELSFYYRRIKAVYEIA